MRQKRRILKKYGMWVIDILCIIISTILAVYIRYDGGRGATLYDKSIYNQLGFIIAVSTVYAFFSNWNNDILHRGYLTEFRAVLQHVFVLVVAGIVLTYCLHTSTIVSRKFYIFFIPIELIISYIAHVLYKKMLIKYFSMERQVLKIVVVAQKSEMDSTIEKIQSTNDSAVQIVGAAYADDTDEADKDYSAWVGNTGVPLYKSSGNITEALVQVPFDEVLINAPDIDTDRLEIMINGFEDMGVDCHLCRKLPERAGSETRIETFKGFDVVTYTMKKYRTSKLMVKRFFDILGGIVGLILTGIICIFLVPAIKFDSEGPVFFSQTRVGKNGRRFKIYKFRSMYMDAEDRLKDLMKNNEMNGLMFKMKDDPRVTKVGKFIRKTSLDEFPQFWNILKGDMSLVGTRPPTEKEFEQYNEHYRRRLQMTPGLTGMWQVSGRSNIQDFDEVVKLDLQYIDNWSLTLDFKIILKTVAIVFTHKGAK